MNTLVITEINFSALPDVKASVNPGSARMVESLEDGVLKEIPVTLRKTPGFAAGSRETYAVIWRIVGATEPLTQRSYYLYFDVTANTNIGPPIRRYLRTTRDCPEKTLLPTEIFLMG